MKKILQILIAVAFVGMIQVSLAENTEFLQKPAEYATHINNNDTQLIDIRRPSEYSAGTIRHAQNIDVLSDDFMQKISALDKNKPVYIFCRSGARSKTARQVMLEAGFTEVYDLEGGYLAWEAMIKEGKPAE